MILAIDTSTGQASVALMHGDSVLAEWSWQARGNHSRLLTPAIQMLLTTEGAEIAALDAVVVAIGPGSFSGVRVGLSEGKGLATALDIPICGVSTLDVVAFAAAPYASNVRAVLPAGRNQWYTAAYAGSGPEWRRTEPYGLAGSEDLMAWMRKRTLLAGEAFEPILEAVGAEDSAQVVPPAARLRRAGYLAELGRLRLAAGESDDIDALEPLYLRRSSAEEKRAATARESS